MTKHDLPPRQNATIATRGSRLALWQTRYVGQILSSRGVEPTELVIKTTGDRVQDRFLHEIGGKGLFTKELEHALLEKRADMAVHSLKDMPARLPKPLCLAAVLKRHSPADAIIFRGDIGRRLGEQAGGSDPMTAEELASIGPLTIATGSLRRQALLKRHLPQMHCRPIRGNVDSRIEKLNDHKNQWDALILAEASIDRLALHHLPYRRLDPQWFVPSASQGALAIETLADSHFAPWLNSLACPQTTLCVELERAILSKLGGSCTMPLGCHVTKASTADDQASARVILLNGQGDGAEALATAPLLEGAHVSPLLNEVLAQLRQAGAAQILSDLGLQVPAELRPR